MIENMMSEISTESSYWNLTRVRKAYGWLCVEIWVLMALGAGVRAMNAGLACPDWPLCFGDVIPDYHPQVYLEFIHRAMAGLISIFSVGLAYWLWKSTEVPKRLKMLSLSALIILAAQVIFGALTVLWLLQEKVVAAHLMLAAVFFSHNLWIYLDLKKLEVSLSSKDMVLLNRESDSHEIRRLKILGRYSWLLLTAVALQLTLGGLVASHYAALICPDFPLCQGQWFPSFQGTLGLQVGHRLGAYILSVLIVLNWFGIHKSFKDTKTSWAVDVLRNSRWLLFMIGLQMGVGIANVLWQTPPLITILHQAFGMVILGFIIKQIYTCQNSK